MPNVFTMDVSSMTNPLPSDWKLANSLLKSLVLNEINELTKLKLQTAV
jgi:hypothetical protein